jgi:hypothetical protein
MERARTPSRAPSMLKIRRYESAEMIRRLPFPDRDSCASYRRGPAGIEPATSRLSVDNPHPSARSHGQEVGGAQRSATELRAPPAGCCLPDDAVARIPIYRSCSDMDPAGIEPATSRVTVDNPLPSARADAPRGRSVARDGALPLSYGPMSVLIHPIRWIQRAHACPKAMPLPAIPYSLFPIPYSLFPIPYSLFPIPCSPAGMRGGARTRDPRVPIILARRPVIATDKGVGEEARCSTL